MNDFLPITEADGVPEMAARDVFIFGKHKGQTVNRVLQIEPSYLLWLDRKNIVSFEIEVLNAAIAQAETLEDYGEDNESRFGDYGDLEDCF